MIAAVGRADHRVVGPALAQRRRVRDERVGEGRGRRPRRTTNSSPMCDRSKSPARSRTARCSSRMPLYWTGMSQPPNSISFAPERLVPLVERRLVDGRVEGLRHLRHRGPRGRWSRSCGTDSSSCRVDDRLGRAGDERPLGLERQQALGLVERDPADGLELVVVPVQVAAGLRP